MGGYAVFRRLVHLVGADLHLEGDAVLVHKGGVQGPVQVGLRHGDVVLEPARQGLPLGVDDAQGSVAVVHRVHDDADGDEVVDLADTHVVALHLAVGGIEMLGTAGELGVDAGLLHELPHAFHGGAQELEPLLLLPGYEAADALIFLRHEILEGQIFELAPQNADAEPMGERRVHLQRLLGLADLFLPGAVLQGVHIVQPVSQLDDDHSHVVGNGQKELGQVLILLLLLGDVLLLAGSGQLGDAIYQMGHLRGEPFGDLVHGDVLPVLHRIV